MLEASLSLDRAFVISPVHMRTFGSFVEHMGRTVYSGIYEPGHPTADDDGFRRDVLDLVRELGVTLVRYPGGNFVSGWRWEDSVGPREQRPTRLDAAWHSIETNEFGLDEFAGWCSKANVEPMLALNFGTRGIQEAIDLLEYCNHPGGTALADLRRGHGRVDPYGIKFWCLGNEMDGPWQLGHMTAHEYGRLAAETARAMRMIDPDLELVACGSSSSEMATFASWEAEVLEHTYNLVDYVSAHAYYQVRNGDIDSFLASSLNMDSFISDVVATCDYVRAKTRSKKRMNISFDEWNVWYLDELQAGSIPRDWVKAPRLSEDPYTVADAVVVGSLMITLLKHSDRVTSACQAQLVNSISVIRAEPAGRAWRQSTFHPFAQAARLARGHVLQVAVVCPTYETTAFGDVPVLDATATFDEEAGRATIFVVNRSRQSSVNLTADLHDLRGRWTVAHTALWDEDLRAANTAEAPDRVRPRAVPDSDVDESMLRATLPPASWNVLELRVDLGDQHVR